MVGRRRSRQLRQADNIGVDRCFHARRPLQLDKPICRHFRRQFDPSIAALPVANSFIENKNPQTHPEASLLVPTELGKGVESLLEQDSKPNHSFTPSRKRFLLAAGRCRGLWFQSPFEVCSSLPGLRILDRQCYNQLENQVTHLSLVRRCLHTTRCHHMSNQRSESLSLNLD